MRDALLAKKGALGVGVVLLSCLLMALGVGAKAGELAVYRWVTQKAGAPLAHAPAVAGGVAVASAVYLALRLGFVLMLSQAALVAMGVVLVAATLAIPLTAKRARTS